jgi:hypothetical protein
MICTRLEGGLGNQLFQYAVGRALALTLGTELVLDASPFNRTNVRITSRPIEIDKFNIQANFLNFTSSPVFRLADNNRLLFYLLSGFNLFRENKLSYISSLFNQKDNTYLLGYWQSYRYFERHKETIALDFLPSMPMSKRSEELLSGILSDESVAIHVRRGDYLSNHKAANFHGVLPISYYNDAIQKVFANVRKPSFFVFSDDPVWCKANLNLPTNSIFVDHNIHEDAWQDLILMSRCHHNIIANSSFSWWAAWLGDQLASAEKERLVLCPSNWFAQGTAVDVVDRFPPTWISL